MLQRFLSLTVVVAAICFGASRAEAKIPIPCTGDKIVKVADLPKTDAFALPGGQHIDLGWIYEGCFSGKWVGYVGTSDRYITWKDGMLPEIVAASGRKAMPAEPGLFWGLRTAPGQFWVEWMFIVLGSAAGLSKLLALKAKLPTALVDQDKAATQPEAQAPTAKAYDAALSAAIAARAAGSNALTAPTRSSAVNAPPAANPRRPARIAAAAPARTLPKGAAPAFGRRAQA